MPRLRVELRSEVFQTTAVTTLATSAKKIPVDQDGVEPSPVLYKSTVLTVELQIHFTKDYIKL